MLLTNVRKEARSPHSHFRAVDGTVAHSFFESDYDLFKEADARIVEGTALRAIDAGAPQPSAFTAFLDGIQRADVKLYHDAVPIVYAYGAAVIRERVARVMRTLWVTEREALFYPSQHLSDDAMGAIRAMGATGASAFDTTPHGSEPVPLFPPLLHARAAQFINRWRETLERELAAKWCAAPNGWLLLDGSLTVSPDVAKCERAVGLIKSHRTRFFDGADARTLLGLKAGQRSSVFEPDTRSVTPVRSWYLRLRPAERHDVFWGLVRVEMAVSQDVAAADEISRWLLGEITPLSLPDARWDRLIYPIHDCEEFLRARAPRL